MRADHTEADAPDEALLARYGAGDAAAARALAARLVPRILALATRLMGGDRAEAEDIAQEAMLRLWRAAPGWRVGEGKVSTWLYRVTVNLCTDRRRRAARREVYPGPEALPEAEDAAPGAADRLAQAERLAALDSALAELPERQRQAVLLRHIEGLPNPEIAEILEIGIEAVESLTARGKRALAANLAGRREELGYHDG